MSDLVPSERIESKIFLIRGQKVMLDFDLAKLYGIETKYLKRQTKRNAKRFPEDFMFELKREEYLRCQNVTSSYGGRRYLPYAFTEQGIAMLSSVLNSERAIQVNIAIMRAFVKLRQVLATHNELTQKFKELELKVDKHDNEIQAIFEAIKQMIAPAAQPQKRIGYMVEKDQ
jgi:phage regulator Rha-like protein